ncbi:hypothetical protein [Parasutterella sp.]|uniref:hypothetical protein n=1 Tax=Parasutterella sp. TaxID=2049037 RepID=UPI0026CC3638
MMSASPTEPRDGISGVMPLFRNSLPVVQAASPEQIKLESFEMMQKHYFEAVLKATKGKISGADGAAALTDMHPNTLRSKLEKLGVTFKAVKPEL